MQSGFSSLDRIAYGKLECTNSYGIQMLLDVCGREYTASLTTNAFAPTDLSRNSYYDVAALSVDLATLMDVPEEVEIHDTVTELIMSGF